MTFLRKNSNDGIFCLEGKYQDEFLGRYESDSNVCQQIANQFNSTLRTNGSLVWHCFIVELRMKDTDVKVLFNAMVNQDNFYFGIMSMSTCLSITECG